MKSNQIHSFCRYTCLYMRERERERETWTHMGFTRRRPVTLWGDISPNSKPNECKAASTTSLLEEEEEDDEDRSMKKELFGRWNGINQLIMVWFLLGIY